jgi:MFS family permease
LKGVVGATFRSYSQLLGIRGARDFVLAGFVGRFPISMRALACLLMVLDARGSYALAGAVSSVVTLTNAASAPVLGRLADRHSQRRLIFMALVVHASGIVGLIVLSQVDAPTWTLFAAAALFGASALPLGSLVRARWAALVGGTPRLSTAYALEALIDDIIYVTGPVVVTVLAARFFPSAGMLVVLTLVTVGWVALALQHGTQPRLAPRADMPKRTAISERGMQALLLVCVTLGAWLGASNVSMVAFAAEHNAAGMGGVLIGLMVLGGMVAGLIYGARSWRTDVVRRLLATTVILGVGSVPLLFANSLGWMALLAVVAGVGITPTLISIYSLLETLVSKMAVTEGFSWIACSITVGASVGTAATGYLVDNAGSWGAYLFLAACGAALPVVVAASRRALGSTPHGRSDGIPLLVIAAGDGTAIRNED